MIIPGTHPNVIAVALGYGRESNDKTKTRQFIGPAAEALVKNVYSLTTFNGTTVDYSARMRRSKKQKKVSRLHKHKHTASQEDRPG